jgi:hypothetical protein
MPVPGVKARSCMDLTAAIPAAIIGPLR